MKAKRMFAPLLSIALVCAVLLAACGGETANSDPNAPKTVTIWHNWQGAYLDAKKAIFDAYMAEHKNVKIELIQQNELVDKSITDVRAKKGPDMIAWVDDALGKLAESRTVIPMDEYISKDYLTENYSAPAAEALIYKDQVYGVPETVEVLTIMYNKELLSEEEIPTNTDELLEFAKSYQEKNPGKYGIVWNPTDAYTNAGFFYGFGAEYVDAEGNVGLDTPEALAAVEYIASFRPYLPSQIDYDIASSLFSEGNAASIINGPWAYADYATNAGIDVGFATLPLISETNTPAKPFVGVKSLWTTSNAEDPALCADIMKFFTSTENQLSMIEASGEIPANAKAASDPKVTDNPVIGNFAKQVETGTPLPNTPYMSALWKPAEDTFKAVWNGSQSPADALKAGQSAAEKGVNDIKEE